ncbi:hypothetical protein SOD10_39350 [Serratia plymuthica]|uniref:Uncharacterized protein n=1 Tax=Serratia plymuthica S13 TaxID=1348660 RepID=S4YRA5_SERPL|nr:hypothetical protein [Serratia plymuthica]AGP46865.1 hypothetical protein M621_05795 [Serratia plymuthica S13]ANJ92407.1 hypothetical protein ADP72_05145 [Serratia plymuthica]KYG14960.1 hypothetical protein SOD10_39350 [Serratia plymuthica]QQT82719.1 hypothetical protein I6I95_02220 [Serratia plymuthica]
MESARDKRTREIVEAEDLWLLDSVDTEGYVCWGCGIEMYPSAWQKGSKKRPSFNKMPGKEHINCDADAESTVVKQGQKKSVRHLLDSAPGLMPAGLKLIERRPAVDHDATGSENKPSSTRSASSTSSEGHAPVRQSRRPVNAIRQICRAFIRFPYDRGMSLNIPGIHAETYMTVFKKLKDPIQSYPERRVFYSQLLWQKFEQDESRIIIPLSGEWTKDESGKPKPSRSYKLHVEWGNWSKAKRTMLLNELDTVQEEAKEAVNKKAKERAQVFFIGEQSADNPESFYVTDYRLICAIMGHITYP